MEFFNDFSFAFIFETSDFVFANAATFENNINILLLSEIKLLYSLLSGLFTLFLLYLLIVHKEGLRLENTKYILSIKIIYNLFKEETSFN